MAGRAVRIGLQVPQAGPNAEAGFVREFVEQARTLGVRSFWVGDHILLGGFQHRANQDETFLDALALLSYLAALSPGIELGASVLIAPYRNPLALCKSLATLGHLSGERLIVGVGAGWAEREFAAVGAPFRERGRLTDQFCQIFTSLRDRPEQPWQIGRCQYAGSGFFPSPSPSSELWVGGNSAAARRRAVRYATGWQPTGLAPEAVAAGRHAIADLAVAAGRGAGEIETGIRLRLRLPPETYRTELPPLLAAYMAAGVTDFLCEINARDRAYTLAAIKRLLDCFRLAGAG